MGSVENCLPLQPKDFRNEWDYILQYTWTFKFGVSWFMFIAKKSIDTHIHIDTSKQEEAPVFKYFFTSEFFQNADFLFIW